MTSVRRPFFFLLVLALALAVYRPAFSNFFVGDDVPMIENNTFIRSAANLPKVFTPAYITTSEEVNSGRRVMSSGELTYRPVTTLTYFLDFALWGYDAKGYHLTNFLWHLANVLVFFFLSLRILGSERAAGLAAVLFLVHPAASEAVILAASRNDQIVHFFMMASVLAFAAGKKPLSLILCVLALFTKENAVALPLLIAAYSLCFGKKEKGESIWRVVAPYIFLTTAYLIIWKAMGSSPAQKLWAYPGQDLFSYVLTAGKTFGYYGRVLVAPLHLHLAVIDPSFAPRSWTEPAALLPWALIAALAALAAAQYRKNPAVTFAIAWMLLSFLPFALSLALQTMRYVYPAAAGFFWLVLIACGRIEGMGKAAGRAAIVLFGAWILFLALVTNSRAAAMHDQIACTREMTVYYPNVARPWWLLARAYREEGMHDEALRAAKRAVKLDPRYFLGYEEIGMTLYQKHLYEAAAGPLSRALLIDPESAPGWTWLGAAYGKMGRYGRAAACLEKAVKLDPTLSSTHFNLGVAYERLGRREEAQKQYLKAKQLELPA